MRQAIVVAALLIPLSAAHAILVPGGGSAKSDCYVEFDVVGLDDATPIAKNKKVVCTEGEACDTGPCGDGRCDMQVAVCMNHADPRLPQCTPPATLDRIKLTPKGRNRGLVTILSPLTTNAASCGAQFLVPIDAGKPRRNGKVRGGVLKLKGFALAPKGTRPRRDPDNLTLQCAPREAECPPATSASTTSTTVRSREGATTSTTTGRKGDPPVTSTSTPTGLTTTSVSTSSGACCIKGACAVTPLERCVSGGTYLGDGTSCTPNPCGSVTTTTLVSGSGACCARRRCVLLDGATCVASGSTYLGNGTTCTPDPCGSPVTTTTTTASSTTTTSTPSTGGACCVSGLCELVSSELECDLRGGTYLGDGSVCGRRCPIVRG